MIMKTMNDFKGSIMKTQHTPGPWYKGVTLLTSMTKQWNKEEIAKNNIIEGKRIYSSFTPLDAGKSRKLICIVENQNDAQLIAAAPDLLRELENAKRIISILDECNPVLTTIINAINKAKGL